MKPLDCARVASMTMQAVLRTYQLLISPLLLPSCRYLPTCSDYAIEALAQHGPLWGKCAAP